MSAARQYEEFLAAKRLVAAPAGLSRVPKLGAHLFAFQEAATRWALKQGRAALFLDCGLGKSACQLEWAKHVAAHTKKPVLILAPLAVAQQTVREAAKFGAVAQYAREQSAITAPVVVTNYEMLDAFDASSFGGVVLDESSILRAFSGVTKRKLVESFARTPFRLACTATPAPNDYIELGNHSEFLGILDSNKMLTRWFVNDTMAAGKWRLKGHAEAEFWRWVTSWAVCASHPHDLGFDDAGYDLPPLTTIQHTAEVDVIEGRGDSLFRDPMMSATGMHKEMRRTAGERARVAADLVRSQGGPWIVWVNTDYEADAVKAELPDIVEVKGGQSLASKEAAVADFIDGKVRVLLSKPSVLGYGLNFQHCCQMAFVGLSYSHEAFFQAVRRCYRFGQTKPVTAHVITAQTEGAVTAAIERKRADHEKLKREMVGAMRANTTWTKGAKRMTDESTARGVVEGEGWKLNMGDCVPIVRAMPSDSVGLSVFSPPFSNLYTYSDSPNDMGNTEDDAKFFEHFAFLVPELLRVTKPGRLCAVHVKNLVSYKGSSGRAGLRDFRGDVIRLFDAHGWQYHSEVTIWKSPVIEMQKTKSHGLLYKQLRKDSSYSRQGLAEYLCVFRKWSGEDVSPVTHTTEDFPLEKWQTYASPVWMDVDQTNVLNVRAAKEDKDSKHLCPLQLDVIERAVDLWTNPGDLVLDPFAGIGSTGAMALKMGRAFVGAELKTSYFELAVRNLKAARGAQLGLFGSAEASP